MIMKKIWSVWAAFFISIILLLLFQSVWLYKVYQLKRYEMEMAMLEIMKQSIAEEVELRRLKSRGGVTLMPNTEVIDLNEFHELNTEEVSEAGIFQQALQFLGFPFEFFTLDSIFRSKLLENHIPVNYLLCYTDSTGNIVEQTGDLALKKQKVTFQSAPFLIVDGKRISVKIEISLFVVSDRMLWLLADSFLMLIVIASCIIYQTKIIFNRNKLNQLRDDFTNTLTHDMKTPLSIIHGVLTKLSGKGLKMPPEKREHFGSLAIKQINKLNNLIIQFLTTAKLENGKLLLDYSEVDFPLIVSDLTERFSQIEEKEVNFSTEIDLQNKKIYLDLSLMEQALANLIDNAVKYSGNPVHIVINCIVKRRRLLISIKDDGFGISIKDRKKIFEKFERGAAATRKGATGFGLGLSFVKNVVNAHKGIISLHSKEGHGSEFIINIPLKNS